MRGALAGHARSPLEPLVYLGAGAAAAAVVAATPLLRFAAWFLRSIVHELGHCAADWFCGAPSIPVISLMGEAMAASQERSNAISLLAVAVGAVAAFRIRAPALRIAVLVALLVGYPLLVLTPLHTLLRALAGHFAEIAFGCLAVHRAWTGGFTEGAGERFAYGLAAWTLLGHELWLLGGLAFSPSARVAYAENGSFGLQNDYLVVAGEWLGGHVGLLAFLMVGLVLAAIGGTLALSIAGASRRG